MTRRFAPLAFRPPRRRSVGTSRSRAQLMLPGAAPAAPQGAKAAPRAKPKSARQREVGRRGPGAASRWPSPGSRAWPGARSCSTASRGCCRFPAMTRRSPSTSCSSPARAFPTRRSAASSTSSARLRSRRPALAVQTDSSGSRPKFPPARSRSTFSTARCLCRPKSPPACSRPPIARPLPAAFGGRTAASLVGDAAKIVKERAEAEKAMGKNRARDRGPQPRTTRRRRTSCAIRTASLAQRDELCRDYAKESVHGYCALRVTEARTGAFAGEAR